MERSVDLDYKYDEFGFLVGKDTSRVRVLIGEMTEDTRTEKCIDDIVEMS